MIIENVNGEARQVFDFSKPDAPAKFYAPLRIGAGYRRRMELAKAGNIIADPKWVAMATGMLKGRQKPRGMSDEDWRDQLQVELKELILSNIQAEDIGGSPDEDLIVLETLLAPAPGSMSVKTWYEEYADESEVLSVVNFSNGIAEVKTGIAQSRKRSGKATSAKAKAVR